MGQRWSGGRGTGGSGITGSGTGTAGGDAVFKTVLHRMGQPRSGAATSLLQPKMISGTKLLRGDPSKSFISKILEDLGILFGNN